MKNDPMVFTRGNDGSAGYLRLSEVNELRRRAGLPLIVNAMVPEQIEVVISQLEASRYVAEFDAEVLYEPADAQLARGRAEGLQLALTYIRSAALDRTAAEPDVSSH